MFGKSKQEKNIIDIVKKAVDTLINEGVLAVNKDEIPPIIVEVPKDESFGDFSINIAMQLARVAKKNPREIAAEIVSKIDTDGTYIDKVDIAGAGFINFTLNNEWLYTELEQVLELKGAYGKLVREDNARVNVEYVSANPTGPLHIGNARGGAIGDVMSSILTWAGYDATKEFYLNDAGNQIEKFGYSLEARFLQSLGEDVPFPEDGYQGEDITALAKLYIEKNSDSLKDTDSEERRAKLTDFALTYNVENMVNDLKNYGIDYDVFFSELSLHESGAIDEIIKELEKTDSIYKKDDALWFKGTKYGLEKDEVLIRNNGIPTYYAADIAYHYNKLVVRGFDWSIDVWGADHHGHVERIKKGLVALGIDENRFDVILMQLVHLVKDNEAFRMSKRKGDIYTLSDLVDEVGKDAARFLFNANKPGTHMEFDLDLAIKKSNENPVFYVQYAHARICNIIKNIGTTPKSADLNLLDKKEELALIKRISSFSEEILKAVKELDPSKMTKYALALAGDFHSFYNAHRVNIEDEKLKNARLCLITGVLQVLRNTLDILGVEAPESM